jgi:hypothetical protein
MQSDEFTHDETYHTRNPHYDEQQTATDALYDHENDDTFDETVFWDDRDGLRR